MIDLAKAQEKIKEYDRFEKNVWNAAIEAAAKVVYSELDADAIRKLKK